MLKSSKTTSISIRILSAPGAFFLFYLASANLLSNFNISGSSIFLYIVGYPLLS